MDWNNFKLYLESWLFNFLVVVCVVCCVFGIIKIITDCCDKNKTTTSPVERCEIDSIEIANDKLMIEVETLDSIKNVQIIEVKSLDNDSTLRLFYQLIGK